MAKSGPPSRETWEKYEQEKAKIRREAKSPEEYDRRLRGLERRLGI